MLIVHYMRKLKIPAQENCEPADIIAGKQDLEEQYEKRFGQTRKKKEIYLATRKKYFNDRVLYL